MSPRVLTCFPLGRVEYADGLELQARFADARAKGAVSDVLLLLEHPPVITLGRGALGENVLLPKAELARRGIELFETDRGGDVTYHGPGQLVGYPIFDLAPDRQDVRRYVRSIEEALIRALARFGITGAREPRWPGVWVQTAQGVRKVAAIGVHISRWITRHGFALNVSTDLSHFEMIVPCGIKEAGVTSMQRLLGVAPPLDEVRRTVEQCFAEVFDAELLAPPQAAKTVAVVPLWREGSERRVLLLRRTPSRGGFWQVVTGRVEPGENPLEAARRELLEETGQDCPIRDLDYRHAFASASSATPQIIEEHAFSAELGESIAVDSREHDAFRWASPDEALAAVPFCGLREAIRRALEQGSTVQR